MRPNEAWLPGGLLNPIDVSPLHVALLNAPLDYEDRALSKAKAHWEANGAKCFRGERESDGDFCPICGSALGDGK